jgi:Insertion element 4 transposase N-terminal/Transposase DDE domain
MSHAVAAAGGRFAPGHLGELTRLVPFEMVDAALEQTCRVQRRVRDLPSRVVVYLLLAACLFPELGYPGVWRKLTTGLGWPGAVPSAGGLAQARRRVGPEPLRFLFDLLRGPAAVPHGRGARWHGLLVCAVDGTIVSVPGTPANLGRFAKGGSFNGGTGYPQARLLTLVACGTRTVMDAVFGPTSRGEGAYARVLLRSLGAGMLVLADRNFAAGALAAEITGTKADFLVRARTGRSAPRFPMLHRCRDGSYLSRFGGVPVRVLDAQVTLTTAAGRRTGLYRLVTSLQDDRRHPAGSLAELYRERWEIETAYYELKSTILGGRVLRARTPAGLDQEIYALLVTYQILRTAIADAAGTVPGTDPDRLSLTIAWQAARDQVTSATGIITSDPRDLAGTIGRQTLAAMLPSRRTRLSPRIVKRAISKYQARASTDRTKGPATLSIKILNQPQPLTTSASP